MQLPQIAFIGAGNMGRALIGGLTRNGVDPARVVVADPSNANWRALSLACAYRPITRPPCRTSMW